MQETKRPASSAAGMTLAVVISAYIMFVLLGIPDGMLGVAWPSRLNPRIRSRFPMIDRDSLGQPRTYLNTGAGSLTVDTAAEAAREAQGRLNPMPGSVVAGEAATAALHARVRDLVADFLHAGGGAEISFHQSATAALFDLAFGLRGVLLPSSNLVVTDLDHMANVSPWETVFAEGLGREVRRARLTPEGTLDVAHCFRSSTPGPVFWP